GRTHVLLYAHTRIRAVVSAPGRYLLRIRYLPYWRVTGEVCVRPAPNGMSWVDATAAGRFSLKVEPGTDAIVRAAERDHETCGPRRARRGESGGTWTRAR